MRFFVIPVLLYFFIKFGVTGLADHPWAIYAMPLIMVAWVVYMAIVQTPKNK